MSESTEPSNSRVAYKAIIDQLVDEARTGISRRLIQQEGIYSKAPGYTDANELVHSMTVEQRQVLADMVLDERVSAISSALSILTWWITCRNVVLTYRGEPMPFNLAEEGLHGDFLARLNGWDWLDDDRTGSK